MSMKKYLMIDDERNLEQHGKYLRENGVDTSKPWSIVKSFNEMVEWVKENGVPDVVTFDHDLGDTSELEMKGVQCARWMIEFCMKNLVPVPEYNVHSSNGPGSKNIESIFETYKKYFKS